MNFDDPSGHGILSWAKSKISNGINKAKTVVNNAWNKVKTTASNAWNSVKTTVSNGINKAKTSISNAWDTAKSTVSNAVNRVKNWASSTFQSFGRSSGNSNQSSSSQSLYEKAKSAGKALFNWSGSKLKEAQNIATSWSESLEKTIRHFCTTAEKVSLDFGESLFAEKIPNGLKKVAGFYNGLPDSVKEKIGGFADLYNILGTETWGKLIHCVTDNNDIESELFDMVKIPVGKLLAFEYNKNGEYYNTNETYGIQRNGGFMDLYDEMDGMLGMDLDTKIINYSYEGVNYRLQLWKGSYGFGNAYGGEIGLYSNTDGGTWYQCVSGEDEIQSEQYIIDKDTGETLLHNDTADYAENRDHYWNLAIKTDSGYDKNDLLQESYIYIEDERKRNELIAILDAQDDLSFYKLSNGRIKIVF